MIFGGEFERTAETLRQGRRRRLLRDTRYNCQNYPLVTATPVEETFKTATAARTRATEHFGAEAGQFATKLVV